MGSAHSNETNIQKKTDFIKQLEKSNPEFLLEQKKNKLRFFWSYYSTSPKEEKDPKWIAYDEDDNIFLEFCYEKFKNGKKIKAELGEYTIDFGNWRLNHSKDISKNLKIIRENPTNVKGFYTETSCRKWEDVEKFKNASSINLNLPLKQTKEDILECNKLYLYMRDSEIDFQNDKTSNLNKNMDPIILKEKLNSNTQIDAKNKPIYEPNTSIKNIPILNEEDLINLDKKVIQNNKFNQSLEDEYEIDEFIKEVKKSKNFFLAIRDLKFITTYTEYFIKLNGELNQLNSVENFVQFKEKKEQIKTKFSEDAYLKYFMSTFLNLIQENFENIYLKRKIVEGQNRFQCNYSNIHSEFNLESLIDCMVEYNVINYLLDDKNKYTDFAYFKDYFSINRNKWENIIYKSFDDYLSKDDFCLLNDQFKISIEQSDYFRANCLREKIKLYFNSKNNKKDSNYCKENNDNEQISFKKNEEIFNKKFNEKKIMNNNKRFNFDLFNPIQKFKFYFIKALMNYSLNLIQIQNRNDYLKDLSHAYIILNSSIFDNFVKNNPYHEGKLINESDIKMNKNYIKKLRNIFFRKFEENNLKNSKENSVFKEINEEQIKILSKIENYYLLFGEFKECLNFIDENTKILNKINQDFGGLKESINSNLNLTKLLYTEISKLSKNESYEICITDDAMLNSTSQINKKDNDDLGKNNNYSNNNNNNQSNSNNNNNQSNNNNNQSNSNNNNNQSNNNNNQNNNNNNQNNNNDNNDPPNPFDHPAGINVGIIVQNNQIEYKILSIDGGGIRGIFALYILRVIEISLNKPIYDLFDFFTGTSIGGLISLCFAYKIYNAETLYREMVGIFKENIFINNTNIRNINKIYRGILSLVSSQTIYSVNLFEDILRSKMIDIQSNELLKLRSNSKNFLITTCKPDRNLNKLIPYCFAKFGADLGFYKINCENLNNIRFIKETNGNYPETEIWEIIRATTAAYPFFKGIDIGGINLIDGGFFFNNPAYLGLEFVKMHHIQPNANQQAIDNFYRKIYLLSLGLEDVQISNVNHRIEINNCFLHPAHDCIIHERDMLKIQSNKEEIIKIMNKISNFCKAKLKNLIGNNFIRIEPDFNNNEIELDAISYKEILTFLNYSENTLMNLGNFHSLRNTNHNYINSVDINTIIRQLLEINRLQNMNLVSRHNFNRKLTRYQKYPLSYHIVSKKLNEIFNTDSTDEKNRKTDELVKILSKFDFKKDIQLYNYMDKLEANIYLPSYLFSNKPLTYALAIGHCGAINFFKGETDLVTHRDNWKYSSFHIAIINDELISFYLILKEYIKISTRLRAYERDNVPRWIHERINDDNGNIIDENDITLEGFLEEGRIINQEIRQNLERLILDMNDIRCGVFHSILGTSGSNSKDFINENSCNNIRSYLKKINDCLQENQLDIIMEV